MSKRWERYKKRRDEEGRNKRETKRATCYTRRRRREKFVRWRWLGRLGFSLAQAYISTSLARAVVSSSSLSLTLFLSNFLLTTCTMPRSTIFCSSLFRYCRISFFLVYHHCKRVFYFIIFYFWNFTIEGTGSVKITTMRFFFEVILKFHWKLYCYIIFIIIRKRMGICK